MAGSAQQWQGALNFPALLHTGGGQACCTRQRGTSRFCASTAACPRLRQPLSLAKDEHAGRDFDERGECGGQSVTCESRALVQRVVGIFLWRWHRRRVLRRDPLRMLFAHLEQCLFDFGWCHRYRAGLCLDLQMGPRGGVVARVSPGSQRGTRLDLGGSTPLLHIGPLITFLCTPCNVCLAVGMRGKHA